MSQKTGNACSREVPFTSGQAAGNLSSQLNPSLYCYILKHSQETAMHSARSKRLIKKGLDFGMSLATKSTGIRVPERRYRHTVQGGLHEEPEALLLTIAWLFPAGHSGGGAKGQRCRSLQQGRCGHRRRACRSGSV